MQPAARSAGLTALIQNPRPELAHACEGLDPASRQDRRHRKCRFQACAGAIRGCCRMTWTQLLLLVLVLVVFNVALVAVLEKIHHAIQQLTTGLNRVAGTLDSVREKMDQFDPRTQNRGL